jgi:hypothetical protein
MNINIPTRKRTKTINNPTNKDSVWINTIIIIYYYVYIFLFFNNNIYYNEFIN